MHKPSVAKTPTVKTASIMLPSTESGLPLDGRKPKYSQSLAVQVTIITVDQKLVRALRLSHSSAPRQALCSPCRTGRPFGLATRDEGEASSPCFTASATTLPMPCEGVGAR